MRRFVTFPEWFVPIAAILVLQATSSFLQRTVPIASPAITREYGWDGSWVGYLSATTTLGALLVVTTGTDRIKRMGAVRALQVALLIGSVAIAFFLVPTVYCALLATLLGGLSVGTAHPAGSEVLQRFTPPAHRNFIFSVKQAGVPLGGIVAGVTIAPLIDAAGWRVGIAATAGLVIVCTLATWHLRARIDDPAPPAEDSKFDGWRSLRRVAVPLQTLFEGEGLVRTAFVGIGLGITQSSWFIFAVTYLVVGLGWSLTSAGLVFAVMQGTAVFGRVLMGWIADRTGSAKLTLAVTGGVSAVTTALWGGLGAVLPEWSMVALAFIAGLSVSSWNGVQIAEVARRAPPGKVAEAASGAGVLIFTSNMIGPIVFAALVAATGTFTLSYMLAAAGSVMSLVLLHGLDRNKASP